MNSSEHTYDRTDATSSRPNTRYRMGHSSTGQRRALDTNILGIGGTDSAFDDGIASSVLAVVPPPNRKALNMQLPALRVSGCAESISSWLTSLILDGANTRIITFSV